MSANNAKLTDPSLLIAAGINPKTGLPIKAGVDNDCALKANIRKQLRIIDEQDSVNQFTWYNLPAGINARLIERILYYKGQGMLFFLEAQNKFYFLPYTLFGTIDVYGRFTGVTPLPFNGTSNDGGKGKEKPWIQGLKFTPIYDVLIPEDYEQASDEEIKSLLKTSCVLLKDYTEQISQTNISMQVLMDPLLDVMAECIPFMRTALQNGTGVQGMRVNTEDEKTSVYAANNAIRRAALEGDAKIPIVGAVDFQELTGGQILKAEEYLLALQSMDNYRLSLHGLDNGGLFQKRSHMLEAEQKSNTGNVGLVMRDKLQCRQEFCNIANSIWGLDMWCEPSEVVLGMDTTGDGIAGDDEAGQNEDIREDNTYALQ